MPVESAADRLLFVSPDDFGELATYTPTGGAAVPAIAGIFNDPHISVQNGIEVSASDSMPTFLCRAADLPAAAAGGDAGDTLALAANELHAAVTYRVIDLQPDGTGLVLLTLGAAS